MNMLFLAIALVSTWGNLDKGPYAVGYKVLDRYHGFATLRYRR